MDFPGLAVRNEARSDVHLVHLTRSLAILSYCELYALKQAVIVHLGRTRMKVYGYDMPNYNSRPLFTYNRKSFRIADRCDVAELVPCYEGSTAESVNPYSVPVPMAGPWE